MIREMKSLRILFDDKLIEVNEKKLYALTPGRIKGQGVFESMRTYRGKIFYLKQHLTRFFYGSRKLNISLTENRGELKKKLYAILNVNRLGESRIRLMAWEKEGSSHKAIVVLAFKPFSRQQYKKGFRGQLSSLILPEDFYLGSIKSLSYRPFFKAYQLASQLGFDEAILLNRKGELVEGSRSNLFIVKDGILMTPSLRSGCLKGITREITIGLAKKMGIQCHERILKPIHLKQANEAFLTNSLIGIMALTSIDGGKIHRGKEGPVTQSLRKAYIQMIKQHLSLKEKVS